MGDKAGTAASLFPFRWGLSAAVVAVVIAAWGGLAAAGTVVNTASTPFPQAVGVSTSCTAGSGCTTVTLPLGAGTACAEEDAVSDGAGDWYESGTALCATPFTSDSLGAVPQNGFTTVALPPGAVLTYAALDIRASMFSGAVTGLRLEVQAGCGPTGQSLSSPVSDTPVDLAVPSWYSTGDTVALPATQALAQVLAYTDCGGSGGSPDGAYLAILPQMGGDPSAGLAVRIAVTGLTIDFMESGQATVGTPGVEPGVIRTASGCAGNGSYCWGPTTLPVTSGPSPSGATPCAVQTSNGERGNSSDAVTALCVTAFTSNPAGQGLSGIYRSLPPLPAGAVLTGATLRVAVGAFSPATSSLSLAVTAGCGPLDTDLPSAVTDRAIAITTGQQTADLPAMQALGQVLDAPACAPGTGGAPQGAYLAIIPTLHGAASACGPYCAAMGLSASLAIVDLTFTYIVPPTGIEVQPSRRTAGQATVHWVPDGDPATTAYVLTARGEAGDQVVYAGPATTSSVTVGCGQMIRFYVAAQGPAGQRTTAAASVPYFSPPCAIQAHSVGPTSIAVRWIQVTGASYLVSWCSAQSCSSPVQGVGSAGSAAITGLAPNTLYTVRSCTTTDTALCPSATVWTAPTSPTALVAQSTGHGIAVRWSGGGNPLGTAYVVTLRSSCGGPVIERVQGSALDQAFGELAPGTPYAVAVAAKGGGGGLSAPAKDCAVWTAPWPAVRTLSADPGAALYQAAVRWGPLPGVPSYTLQGLVAGAWSTIYVGAATAFDTTRQRCGQTTTYRVAPTAAQMTWTVSEPFTAIPCPPAITMTVGGLGWSPSRGRGFVHLSWSPVAGATGYRVWMFDGAVYEGWEVGDVTAWDSRQAAIYPSPEALVPAVAAPVSPPLLLHGGGGLDLRDRPENLYCTAGTAYCGASVRNYWFTVSAYNAAGDSSVSPGGTDPCSGVARDRCLRPVLPLQTDGAAPTVTTLQIDGGTSTTYRSEVTLTLAASESPSGVAAVGLSNDGVNWSDIAVPGCTVGQVAACAGSWSGEVPWTLTPGTGDKTVLVRAESTAGVWSLPRQARIESIADPAHLVVDVATEGNVARTSATQVALAVTVIDAGVQAPTFAMRTSVDGGQSWSGWAGEASLTSWRAAVTVPGGASGSRTVLVQVRDQYSDVGQGGVVITYVDPALPSPGSIAASPPRPCAWPLQTTMGAAVCTAQSQIDLTLNPPGNAVQMRASLNGVTWGPWQSPRRVLPLNVGGSPGLKTIWVQYRDGQGNITAAPRHNPASVVYDPDPPTVRAAWLGNASATDSSGHAVLALTASDDAGGSHDLTVIVASNGTVLYKGPYEATIPIVLTGRGYQFVEVTVRDAAGNSSGVELGIYRA